MNNGRKIEEVFMGITPQMVEKAMQTFSLGVIVEAPFEVSITEKGSRLSCEERFVGMVVFANQDYFVLESCKGTGVRCCYNYVDTVINPERFNLVA